MGKAIKKIVECTLLCQKIWYSDKQGQSLDFLWAGGNLSMFLW